VSDQSHCLAECLEQHCTAFSYNRNTRYCELYHLSIGLTPYLQPQQDTTLYVRDCLTANQACYEETNRFGYMVTTDGLNFGDSANYSCWPGYTHVTGDFNRTCLSSLVWSGRRPTCELNCTSKERQQCIKCKGEKDSSKVCAFEPIKISSQECHGALRPDLGVLSVYKGDSDCFKYECEETIDGVADSTTEWTSRYSCAKGNLHSISYLERYTDTKGNLK